MCSALLKQIQSLVGTFHDDADGAVVTAEYVSCHLLLFGTGLVIQRNYNTCVPRLSPLTRQNLELYNPSTCFIWRFCFWVGIRSNSFVLFVSRRNLCELYALMSVCTNSGYQALFFNFQMSLETRLGFAS